MADTLGQFMKPVSHSDKPAADIQPAPNLSIPAVIPTEPAPVLSQPHPPMNAEQEPYSVPGDRHPGTYPTPELAVPPVVPFEPAPPLSTPPVIPFEPAPQLSAPPIVPFEPPPPLSVTGTIAFQPAPELSVIHPPTTGQQAPYDGPFPDVHPGIQASPVLSITGALAPQPPPTLSQTGSVPFQAAPPLGTTGSLPVMPSPPLVGPGDLPKMVAPPLSAPAVIPFEPAPQLDKIHHPWTLDDYAQIDPPAHPGAKIEPVKVRAPQYLPDLPYFVFHDQVWHSTVVDGAEMRNNSLPGFAYETAEAAGAAVRSLHLNVGIGPWNVGIGGFGVVTNFDPRQLAKTIRDAAISSVKAVGQGALNAVGQGLTRLINPFMISGGPGAGTPTVISGVLAPTQDYVFTYAQDSRAWLQSVQERAAADNDYMMYNSPVANRFNNNYTTTVDVWSNQGTRVAARQDIDLVRAFGSNIQTVTGNDMTALGSYNTRYKPLSNALDADDVGISYTTELTETVIPLVFTDLRRQDGGSIRFQPFIKSLTENFTPQWNMQNYFGRVDPVATYQSTGRTINLAFQLVCFDRTDLDVIFKKLAWLTSMVYPEYEDRLYSRGPVIRLRIGDIINANGGGLTGVINSLNLGYDDAIWELDRNAKLPRNIDVSIGFQVLHENPVGLMNLNGQLLFGGIKTVRTEGDVDVVTATDVNVSDFRAALGENNEYLYNGQQATSTMLPIPTAITIPTAQSIAAIVGTPAPEGGVASDV